MYQGYQQNNFQNQMGANVNSQYRGLDTKYQPIGYVQSQYNQSLNPSFSNQFQNSSNQYSSFQAQAPQSYHTANYRGDQPGHDAYLRSDSTQPAQSQYAAGFSSQTPAYGSYASSFSNQQQFIQQSPQSYHTANYRGNQPGHDAYLRSDSSQPAQSQFGMGAAANYNTFSTGMGIGSSYGASQSQQFQQNPQAYHTASYRGNQPGHDAYLRSDSSQPAQSQFGTQNIGMNRYQF